MRAAVSRIRMLRTPYNGHSTELKPVVPATVSMSVTLTHAYTHVRNVTRRRRIGETLHEFPPRGLFLSGPPRSRRRRLEFRSGHASRDVPSVAR